MRNQRRLRDEYRKLYDEFVVILARHDPIYLTSAGAPADEYEPEAEAILARAFKVGSVQAMERIIGEEFAKSFGSRYSDSVDYYKPIASEFWSASEGLREDQTRQRDDDQSNR